MALQFNPLLTAVFQNGVPVSKNEVSQLFGQVRDWLETALYRNTRVYASRDDAVTAIVNEPPAPAVVRVITIENDALVVRGRNHPSPDPLFSTGDPWGELLRLDKSDLSQPQRLATFYFNRADAVAGLPAVPADVYRVLSIEGGVLTIRARELTTDDPLFSTGARWGVQQRINVAALSTAIAAEAQARQSALQDEESARSAAIAEASDLLRAADAELSLRIDALSISASLGLYVASSVQDGLDNTEDGDVFLLIDAGSAAFTRNLSGQAVELYRFVSGRAIDLRPLPFATRVDAEGASIPVEVGQIVVGGLEYRRDPEGMALQTQDGARWSPRGTPTTAHFATVQEAIDWVGGRGGDLLVPPGITSSPALNLTKLGAGGRRVILRGVSEESCLMITPGTDGNLIYAGSSTVSGGALGWTFRDMTIECGVGAAGTTGVFLERANTAEFKNVRFVGVADAIAAANTFSVLVESCWGLNLEGDFFRADTQIYHLKMRDNKVFGIGGYLAQFKSTVPSRNVVIEGNDTEVCGGAVKSAGKISAFRYVGNYLEQASGQIFDFAQRVRGSIVANDLQLSVPNHIENFSGRIDENTLYEQVISYADTCEIRSSEDNEVGPGSSIPRVPSAAV